MNMAIHEMEIREEAFEQGYEQGYKQSYQQRYQLNYQLGIELGIKQAREEFLTRLINAQRNGAITLEQLALLVGMFVDGFLEKKRTE